MKLALVAALVLALAGTAAWMPLWGTALCSLAMFALIPACTPRETR